ncbi:MAG: leucine--tRNA ligase [Patescibacteria group bacterium]|nr:leucine--tRNA ligase [Patescibacteria group bacterium]
MRKYPFKKIEKKWQEIWQKNNFSLWQAKDLAKQKKIYILDMFPYPSGDGLHVGHVEGYTATDILSRFYRMNGYNVLHPMGFDAFGLPAENFAIKKKKNPIDFVPKNIERFRKQLKSLGLSYDWQRELSTTDPSYYKWTQYIFLKMYERGLVYEKSAPINFCPSCQTGLADEEVIGGKCERCGTATEIRNLKQWHIRITAYAERLLEDLDELDWPENVKEMQRNWIGKSVGYEVLFMVDGFEERIAIFTTRLDTIYGVTFIVLSPANELALKISHPNYLLNVERYVQEERKKEKAGIYDKEISGVFTGSYAINPLNQKKIPIWVSNYVLATYGTGAIMGVPAHDERDFNFAKKFDLEVIRVVVPTEGVQNFEEIFIEDGVVINSDEFSGLSSEEAREKIGEKLSSLGLARKVVNYRLRDWIFSRQRYWGEPIPLIRCPRCGIVPLKEKDLPLVLPRVKYYKPSGTGESPLKNISKWVKTRCPKCKGEAERETQTMPQWAGSCWYYIGYLLKSKKLRNWDKRLLQYWLPVDVYVGGVEHAVLHLLYARFWHKFLYDIKMVPTKEPFVKLVNQGLILGPDGQKMSKSRGNVINPDDVIKEYGADTLRIYEMFMGPLEDSKPWSIESIKGVFRFLNRVWALAGQVKKNKIRKNKDQEILAEVRVKLNELIYETTEGIKNLKFNVVIAKMMSFENFLRNFLSKNSNLNIVDEFLIFIRLLFPFAPHISQEIFSLLGGKSLLDLEKWPEYDKELLVRKTFNYVVQVNGKKRGVIVSEKENLTENEVKELVSEQTFYKKYIKGKKVVKIVFVRGKVINFVIGE